MEEREAVALQWQVILSGKQVSGPKDEVSATVSQLLATQHERQAFQWSTVASKVTFIVQALCRQLSLIESGATCG